MNAVERYVFHLRRWWWVIVVVALVTGALGYLVSSSSAGSYSATATLQIDIEDSQDSRVDEQLAAERLTKTYVLLIKTDPILAEAAERLGGPETAGDLDGQVTAVGVLETPLIEVTASDVDAERAAAIANTVAQVFVEDITGDEVTPALEGEEAANQQSGRVVVSIVEPAETPGSASGPSVPIQTFAAMIAGASLVMIVLAGRAYFDSSIWNPEDLRAAGIGLPCLGVLPSGGLGSTTLLTSGHGLPALTESTRTITTTALSALSRLKQPDNGCQAVGVVSAMRGEGRTSVTARLGVAAAMEGLSITLVDFDLRHPQLHEQFRTQNDFGITDAMWAAGTRTLALGNTGTNVLEHLRIVPAGQDPSLPAKRLNAGEVSSVVEKLRSNGTDIMFFDTPPLSDGTEAVVLGQVLDAAIIVVEARRATVEDVNSVNGQMEALGLTVLGYVLNKR